MGLRAAKQPEKPAPTERLDPSNVNISGLAWVLVLSTRFCVFSNTLAFGNLSERELRKRLSHQ